MKRNLRRAFPCLAVIAVLFAAYEAGLLTSTDAHSVSPSERPLPGAGPIYPSFRPDGPGGAAETAHDPAHAIRIDGTLLEGPGVTVGIAKRERLYRQFRVTGRIAANENGIRTIQAGAAGLVTSLDNNPVGTVVRKGELLATLFSNEFLRSQQAYFFALAALDQGRAGDRDTAEQIRQNEVVVRANEDALRALGMGDFQIQELARTRRTTENIQVSSPINGLVLERNLFRDQILSPGDELYRIADLDHVWILADLLPDQAQAVRPGTKIRLSAHDIAEAFYVTVRSNLPIFDPLSRLPKIRLEVDNPGLRLRPGAFTDIELRDETLPVISIPTSAVVDSGLNKIVFVKTGPGAFEPRTVELGRVYQDRVIVLKGIKENERVVTSANFAKDSESRLRAASRSAGLAAPRAKEPGTVPMFADSR